MGLNSPPKLSSTRTDRKRWSSGLCVLPWRGSEEKTIKEAAAEIFQGKFISQQRQAPSEQVEKDVTEGQVTEGLHCKQQSGSSSAHRASHDPKI